MPRLMGVALVVVVAAGATGCGSRAGATGHRAAGTHVVAATTLPSGTSAVATETSPPVEPTTGPPTSAASPPLAVGAPCVARQLGWNDIDAEVPDGHPFGPVVVHNTSDVACTLHGYFGVNLVNQIGVQIGRSVNHRPGPLATITLGPNGAGTASFLIGSPGGDANSNCDDTKAITLSPPGYDRTTDGPSWNYHVSFEICNDTVEVTPIVAGSSGESGKS